jgi:WD40 repeat protein
MARFDRVLIQPTPDALREALAHAAAAANGGARTNRVLHTPKAVEKALAEAAASPEGVRYWERGDERPRRPREAVVFLAWWSDAVGRRHLRVAVRRAQEVAPPKGGAGRVFRAQDRPPLWQVYPGRVWLRIRAGRPEPLVWCRCGACGTPEAVAWMGECCGPCHDRREEGLRVPENGPEQTVLASHSDAAFGLAFSPDGRTLATGAMDCLVKLWDMATGRERRSVIHHQHRVDTLAYSPDGCILASGDDDGVVVLHNMALLKGEAEPQRWARILSHRPTGFLGFGFTPDGRHFAVKHSGLTVWKIRRRGVTSFDAVKVSDLPSAVGMRGRLAVAAGGTLLATNANGERMLALWDRESGEPRGRLAGHTGMINCVAASPDGGTVATASDDKTVRLWDVQECRERRVLRGHTGSVWGVAFSADGRVVASAGSEDETLRLWDAETARERAVWAWHLDRIFSVAFSPDGRWLASGGEDGTVRLWPWRALLET